MSKQIAETIFQENAKYISEDLVRVQIDMFSGFVRIATIVFVIHEVEKVAIITSPKIYPDVNMRDYLAIQDQILLKSHEFIADWIASL